MLAAGGVHGQRPGPDRRLSWPRLVANKQVRFVMGLGGGGMRGGAAAPSVGAWIQANCQVVDPALYQGSADGGGFFGGFFGGFGGRGGNSQLYDCAALK